MIGILVLLQLRGFDTSQRFKLVRHQSATLDVDDLRRRGWLVAYQAFQRKPIFDSLDYIVSFVATGRTWARLEGIYKVLERKPGKEGTLPPGCPYEQWKDCDCYYDLQRVPGFEDLEDRAVIDWGKGSRAWHQRPSNKEVVELLPAGQRLRPFTDYLEFTLTHSELRYLSAEVEANREWQARLSAVAGVYLILATTTGAQYIGSAHGSNGIWGRWQAYANNGHGGNKRLRELVSQNSAYPDAFTYSILQILPPTFAHSEVLKWEGLYKQKLGSRAVGLNEN
jgi:hypothetical protein